MNVTMAPSASVFILVCEKCVVMCSNLTGVFCIVTSEIVNLSVQLKMTNNRKLESSLIGAMVTTLA